MGRAGKLDVNIDKVRLADGEKAALRGVRDAKGGSHSGAVTAAVVGTSLVVWPAAPLFLLIHGKDVTIPKGTEITAYVSGNMTLDGSRFNPVVSILPVNNPNAPADTGSYIARSTPIQSVRPSLAEANQPLFTEPAFSDVFFRLSGGGLVALERRTITIDSKASGLFEVNVDTEAELSGARSPVRFPANIPLEFVVRLPFSSSAIDPNAAYALRKLASKEKTRELQILSERGSVLGASVKSSLAESALPVDFSKYGASSLKMTAPALPPGEYAVSSHHSETVFCFGVD
jgi:hypothetical protein